MKQPPPHPTFKQFLVDLALADGERSGIPNYWGFLVIGGMLLFFALCTAQGGLHGFVLWHQGMPLDTPAFVGPKGHVRTILDDMELFLFPLLLSLFCLPIGLLARRARLKRDREALHFDPIED